MSGIEPAFLGSLDRDAEVRTGKTGKAYLRLNVRVGDGDAAQWVSVLAFDAKAVEQADKPRSPVQGQLRGTTQGLRGLGFAVNLALQKVEQLCGRR
jgi:hypothetical protein